MADYGPRLRAARGWANLSQEELARKLERNKQFVADRERAPSEDRWRKPTRGDLIAIAAVCGVPLEFLEEGFGGAAQSEISERLATVEVTLRDVERAVVVLAREASPRNAAGDQPEEESQ